MRSHTDPRYDLGTELYDPATISLATLGISAVSTIGGLAQGVSNSGKNSQIEAQKQADVQRLRDMAQQMIQGVRKEEYDKLANADMHAAMKSVSDIMAQRGIGLGSSALASTTADASAQIRGAYGKQYLQDKQQAQQGALSALSGVAQMPAYGYTQDPYADFGAGLGGISAWAAQNAYGIGVDPVVAHQKALKAAGG